ncbi:MAG: protein phosphatase 2C domain-containing protein [Thermoplasmatales archaeon]
MIEAETVKGSSRENNEDSFAIIQMCNDEEKALISVADGMGGGDYGEIASSIAVHSMVSGFSEGAKRDFDFERLCDIVLESFSSANQKIRQVTFDLNARWMGTTMTSMMVIGRRAFIGNIGDSRTYVFDRQGNIIFRTKDHTYAQNLVDSGYSIYRDVRGDYRRNELTRAIGISENIEPDYSVFELWPGYSAVLCTDGFWAYLEDDEIAGLALNRGTSASDMVKVARDSGSQDDITVVFLSF